MASAPERNTAPQEEEPLLGGPGDATQHPGQGLQWNFVKGTAILAQAGIFILTALIWAAILSNDVIFFSYHPLLNSLAVLLFTQGILVLQPTSTPKDKITGTYVHSVLNTLAVALAIAGLVVIEMNKASHPETRFQSLHGKMALVAYIVVGFQWVAGAAMFFLQGSVIEVDKAKSLYKYHRISGYVLAVWFLAVVAAATSTPYNANVAHIKLWAVVVASLLVLVGVVPRIKKSKLGF